jgi:hypothetical protein
MDDRGQLYTMEGVAAALIMLLTIYFVLNATSVYTAGDTHITDMQLEALGSDALVMMDTAPNGTAHPSLQGIIEVLDQDNRTRFNSDFLGYINAAGTGPTHTIQYNATYTCRNTTADADPPTISCVIASTRNLTAGEHTVRATRWVLVDSQKSPYGCCSVSEPDPRAVLVEVLLWRD